MLERYWIKKIAEEAEHPVYESIREKMAVLFHPDSETMKSVSHGGEGSKIEVQPVTDFDPDADVPFAGLDAPLGG